MSRVHLVIKGMKSKNLSVLVFLVKRIAHLQNCTQGVEKNADNWIFETNNDNTEFTMKLSCPVEKAAKFKNRLQAIGCVVEEESGYLKQHLDLITHLAQQLFNEAQILRPYSENITTFINFPAYDDASRAGINAGITPFADCGKNIELSKGGWRAEKIGTNNKTIDGSCAFVDEALTEGIYYWEMKAHCTGPFNQTEKEQPYILIGVCNADFKANSLLPDIDRWAAVRSNTRRQTPADLWNYSVKEEKSGHNLSRKWQERRMSEMGNYIEIREISNEFLPVAHAFKDLENIHAAMFKFNHPDTKDIYALGCELNMNTRELQFYIKTSQQSSLQKCGMPLDIANNIKVKRFAQIMRTGDYVEYSVPTMIPDTQQAECAQYWHVPLTISPKKSNE